MKKLLGCYNSYHDYCHRYIIEHFGTIAIIEDGLNAYSIRIDTEELNVLTSLLEEIVPEGRSISAKNVIGLAQRVFPHLVWCVISTDHLDEASFDVEKEMYLERINSPKIYDGADI